MSKSGIAGPYDNSVFNFLRNHHTVFHGSSTILHSHQFLHLLTNTCRFLICFVVIVAWYCDLWDILSSPQFLAHNSPKPLEFPKGGGWGRWGVFCHVNEWLLEGSCELIDCLWNPTCDYWAGTFSPTYPPPPGKGEGLKMEFICSWPVTNGVSIRTQEDTLLVLLLESLHSLEPECLSVPPCCALSQAPSQEIGAAAMPVSLGMA